MSFFIFMIESQFLRRKKLWGIAYGTVTYAKYPVAREKLKREEKWTYFIKSCSYWHFHVSPVIKSPCSNEGIWVRSLVREDSACPVVQHPPPTHTHTLTLTHTHTQIRASCSYWSWLSWSHSVSLFCSSPTSFLLQGLHLPLHLWSWWPL